MGNWPELQTIDELAAEYEFKMNDFLEELHEEEEHHD